MIVIDEKAYGKMSVKKKEELRSEVGEFWTEIRFSNVDIFVLPKMKPF